MLIYAKNIAFFRLCFGVAGAKSTIKLFS